MVSTLLLVFLCTLSPSLASEQCTDGRCQGSAQEGFPPDETSLLQVQSSVQQHGAAKQGKSLKSDIPEWLKTALVYIENGKEQGGTPFMDVTGLWRTAGNGVDATNLAKSWTDGGSSVEPGTAAATVASAIGKMIKQAPVGPLLRDATVTNIAKASASSSAKLVNGNLVSEVEADNLWMMINTMLLPPPDGMGDITPERLSVLKALMEHWHKVVEHAGQNSMFVKVMATCAAPMLFAGDETLNQRTYDKTNDRQGPSTQVPYKAMMDAFKETPTGKAFIAKLEFMINQPARVGEE